MNAPLIMLSSSFACVVLASAVPAAEPVTKTIRSDDGLRLVCDIRGTGDTALVFLHGWCCDRAHWKHQVEVFAADYRVVALDLAGHGVSGKDRKEWTGQGQAADVEAVAKQLGLRRVIIVGHSAGGVIGLMAAKRMPGTVVAVVGVDTLHNVEQRRGEESTKKLLDELKADFKGRVRGFTSEALHPTADPELKKWIAARAEAQDPTMAIELMRGRTADFAAMLSEAKVPVRCINAVARPTAVAANKKYGDYDAILMEGVGHFPMLEKPAEFNRTLREVLKDFAAKK